MSAATEPEERRIRLKRLAMRATHRGIREMDIILGRYTEQRLESLDEAGLAAFEAALTENDQDLYRWVTGQDQPPADLQAILRDIARIGCRR